MPKIRSANRDQVWLYAHPNVASGNEGDGLLPHRPITVQGGLISCLIDVNVPATTSGNLADFSVTYPTLAPTPNVFPLLRYSNPIDTAKKLNGKGNVLITNLLVLYGANICGAAPPGASGTKSWDMVIKIGSRTVWSHNGPQTYDTTVNRVSAASPFVECFLGGDYGQTEMKIDSFTANENLTAGRFRIWWQLSEV